MRRRPWPAVLGLAVALGACPPARAGGGPVPQAEGYQGVVVWLHPAADTVPVSFTAEWRRVPAGADTAWAFARAASGEQWVHGRMEGDSLVWGISGMAGDAGSSFEFAGVPEADGTVRGCLRVPRRGWSPGEPRPRAAFALRPAGAPAPSPADAPVRRCG